MNDVGHATASPALGVLIFTLGGLAGAVFYLPFKKVKNWAWESYWMIYAVFGLIVVPWLLALSTAPNVMSVLKATPRPELAYCYLCGAMWGVGGLTWGLMIRYLGVGLGLAIGCGLCSAAGTLVPKILRGEFGQLFQSSAGVVSLVGVFVSLIGIVMVGMAGMSKEKELPEAEKKKAVAEFNFRKGIMVAIFSGLMSAGMGFGLVGGPASEFKAQYGSQTRIAKGQPNQLPQELSDAPRSFYDKDAQWWVAPAALPGERTTSTTWRGMPVLVVVLLGGFAVNFFWCLFLNLKNKTTSDYLKSDSPLIGNLLFAGLAGAIWCSQFICFKTGAPAMGRTAYVGWAVLMAAQIMFSTLLGIFLGEWRGTSARTRSLLAAGLALLVLTAFITGYSGYLSQQS
jgi:L-rhamnose-H+ transport protein